MTGTWLFVVRVTMNSSKATDRVALCSQKFYLRSFFIGYHLSTDDVCVM